MCVRVCLEIAHNRSTRQAVRIKAIEMLAERGLHDLLRPERLGGFVKAFYVYSTHDALGRMIYVGKGVRRRHLASAKRLAGRSRVRAEFYSEREALAFELRLIKRFRPRCNIAGIAEIREPGITPVSVCAN